MFNTESVILIEDFGVDFKKLELECMFLGQTKKCYLISSPDEIYFLLSCQSCFKHLYFDRCMKLTEKGKSWNKSEHVFDDFTEHNQRLILFGNPSGSEIEEGKEKVKFRLLSLDGLCFLTLFS
jgi:hypothetical protein